MDARCLFCSRQEYQFHMGKRQLSPTDTQAVTLVCSVCVQRLLRLSSGDLRKAWRAAKDKGSQDKADYLESILQVAQEGAKSPPGSTNGVKGRG